MDLRRLETTGVCLLLIVAMLGCSVNNPVVNLSGSNTPQPSLDETSASLAKLVSYQQPVDPPRVPAQAVQPPLSLEKRAADDWPLTLDEVIQIALSNSTVLRGLGGRVIQAPELTQTVYGPSLQATDPRFGIESALSEFDAQFATRAFYEKNDRALNNILLGGGTYFFDQDLWRFQTELRKRAATGTVFSLRHNVDDDLNNAARNLFGTADVERVINAHAWTWNAEAEMRQPLLQGRGVEFNRIAGPDATPGVINGVVIARLNTSISAADFQLALRNFVSNVENAYWDLYFAYRDLEAKKTARDRTLDTYQKLKALAKEKVIGAEADKLAQAAEQYYRFEQDVEDSLSGLLVDGTRDFNGSTGGTFQGVSGVFVNERRLRLIMGLPINDGRLIRPVTTPCEANVLFSWDDVVAKSLNQRVELTRQNLRVQRREAELIASRNFLMPRVDLVGRYRWRGLGDHLYDPVVPSEDSSQWVHSGTNEWQFGMEWTSTVGFRRAHSAVRNAELELARERAILREAERQIVHDLSNSVAEKERAFKVLQVARNRRMAAEQQLEILMSPVHQQTVQRIEYNLILDAQRRAGEAQIAYYRALTAYAVALKNVYLEIGSLFDYCNIQFSEELVANPIPHG
jgi:outer membrane protein TolC